MFLTAPDGAVPPQREGLDGYVGFDAVSSHGGFDDRLAFAPDGRHLATGDRSGEVWIWDLEAATQTATFSVDDPEYLTGLRYHPDGDLLAALDVACHLDVWDVGTVANMYERQLGFSSCYENQPLAFSTDGSHPIKVAFTADGGHVVVGYQTSVLELWRLPGATRWSRPSPNRASLCRCRATSCSTPVQRRCVAMPTDRSPTWRPI